MRHSVTSISAARGLGGSGGHTLALAIPAPAVRPESPPARLLRRGLDAPSGRVEPAEVGPSAGRGRHEAIQAQGGSQVGRSVLGPILIIPEAKGTKFEDVTKLGSPKALMGDEGGGAAPVAKSKGLAGVGRGRRVLKGPSRRLEADSNLSRLPGRDLVREEPLVGEIGPRWPPQVPIFGIRLSGPGGSQK